MKIFMQLLAALATLSGFVFTMAGIVDQNVVFALAALASWAGGMTALIVSDHF